MKKILILILVLSIAEQLIAQQLPMYSQYMNNRFLLNPAVAGSENCIPIRLTVRQQWVGIQNAPSTQALSAHAKIANQKIGVGGYVFSDRFGIDSKTGFQASFSYILPIRLFESELALGLSFMGFQYAFNSSDAKITDLNDPTVSGTIESAFVPDANFGVYWHNNDFFVGLSANQLVEYKVQFSGLDATENTLQRHFFLMGGYKFELSKSVELEPSVMLKYVTSAPLNTDINVKAIYNKNYWFGVSYRSGVPFNTGNSLVAMIGTKYKKFYIAYAYDYIFSNLGNYSSGNHEIMIGININEKTNRGSSLL